MAGNGECANVMWIDLERIANTFTANWIPASAGMTLLVFWSVIPAQPVPGPLGDLSQILPGLVPSPYWGAGIQNLLASLANANENRTTVYQSHMIRFSARLPTQGAPTWGRKPNDTILPPFSHDAVHAYDQPTNNSAGTQTL